MTYFKQKGIGLLELMLALAIIAVLLIMATRYYASAHQNQQISTAVDMISAVGGAAKSYFNDNHTTDASVSNLVKGGYLPKSYGTGANANPWNGSISCTISGGEVNVEMTSIPSDVCTKLDSRLQQTTNSGSGGCSGSTATATYPL